MCLYYIIVLNFWSQLDGKKIDLNVLETFLWYIAKYSVFFNQDYFSIIYNKNSPLPHFLTLAFFTSNIL